jgi:hypothetical protein
VWSLHGYASPKMFETKGIKIIIIKIGKEKHKP